MEPEYMATEVLGSMMGDGEEGEFDLWHGGVNLSDVYSLGLAFL